MYTWIVLVTIHGHHQTEVSIGRLVRRTVNVGIHLDPRRGEIRPESENSGTLKED